MGCLELQAEPRKMSIYREEAVDVLIMCLRNSDNPDAQIAAAETLLVLLGRFPILVNLLSGSFYLNVQDLAGQIVMWRKMILEICLVVKRQRSVSFL